MTDSAPRYETSETQEIDMFSSDLRSPGACDGEVVELEHLIDELHAWLRQEMDEAVGGSYEKRQPCDRQLAHHFAGRYRN